MPIQSLKYNRQNLIPVFIGFVFLFSPYSLSIGQTFVQDTLKVQFPRLIEGPNSFTIEAVTDLRDGSSDVLGISETTHYVFVPVDLIICLDQPLAETVQSILSRVNADSNQPTFQLAIEDFDVSRRSGSWIYPHYRVSAAIKVHGQTPSGREKEVRLLYESKSRTKFFGDKPKVGYKKVLGKFSGELAHDLDQLVRTQNWNSLLKNPRFHLGLKMPKRNHLIWQADGFYGSKGWLMDVSLLFVQREAEKKFYQGRGKFLRYRNMDDYESIEYGLSIDRWNMRFHEYWMFECKSIFALGINKWKDIDTVDHKFYDAFLLDFSLSQGFIFNPLHTSGLTFGIGVMENLFYVYSKGLEFQAGVFVRAGVKL